MLLSATPSLHVVIVIIVVVIVCSSGHGFTILPAVIAPRRASNRQLIPVTEGTTPGRDYNILPIDSRRPTHLQHAS
jgi:hypothetical protein